MDAVIDISARAVSYLNLIQDIIMNARLTEVKENGDSGDSLNLAQALNELVDNNRPSAKFISYKNQAKDIFRKRAEELVPICQNQDVDVIDKWTLKLMTELIRWLNKYAGEFFGRLDDRNFPTPYKWRELISEMLYKFPERRFSLTQALQYLPLQVVLAIGGGKYNAEEQQILQVWNDLAWRTNADEPKIVEESDIDNVQILSASEVEFRNTFQKEAFITYVTTICLNFKKEARRKYDEDSEVRNKLYEKFKTQVCETIQQQQTNEQVNGICINYIADTIKDIEANDCNVVRCIRRCNRFRDELVNYIKSNEELQLQFYFIQAKKLLLNDDELIKELINSNSPLPFESVLRTELAEIKESRQQRCVERLLDGENVKQDSIVATNKNPYIRAEEMDLCAIAFSGGGIRSATFNLGILQGLASLKRLNRIDYMSTVSGGGYIGSWLSSWIKREGSLKKVSDRLDPHKCVDPMAEEVRPIRWLRMFSNYFAPNASIMSTDSWTIGVTWIRNMVLNLVVILLLLLTVLMGGYFVYKLWLFISGVSASFLIYSCSILLLLASILTGLGMNAYVSKRNRSKEGTSWTESLERITGKARGWFLRSTKGISLIVLFCGIVGAYMISAYLYQTQFEFSNSSYLLLGEAMSITVICLLIVAALGRYDLCIAAIDKGQKKLIVSGKSIVILLGSAAFAVIIGGICLGGLWYLLYNLNDNPTNLNKRIAFIVGVPLMLEVCSITVVARMAFLGRYFPDERREWWGRMGAVVHRLSFAWLAVTSVTLLGMQIIIPILEDHLERKIATAGGWIAIVGLAVKTAYSAKTSTDKNATEKGSVWLNLFSQVGPYIFIIGLLIFLPALLLPLIEKVNQFANNIANYLFIPRLYDNSWRQFTAILLIIPVIGFMALFTWRLALRLGVNEFSMHHFYRNRLVRAYLGATRRRTDRDKTANPFTNFDMGDDEKLSEFTNQKGYYGPYPILNAALNASQVTELDRQDRKAESFIFSPLFSGFDFSRTRSAVATKKKSYDYGFRQSAEYAFPGGPAIGTAMAISGAAVNPNQGYHSSAATAFLLTVFNLQMGWWIGNPRKASWQQGDPPFGLTYIVNNLIGKTDTSSDFVALSDGGHFDNMGLYELVRRRCRFIILCDAEQDQSFSCEGLANAIRKCRVDFGVEINLDTCKIRKRDENNFSEAHYTLGSINYPQATSNKAYLLYIKSSIVNCSEKPLPVDVIEYAQKNKTFPHQTTADQFFDEEQFESYRKLGLHISNIVFKDDNVRNSWISVAGD